MLFLLGFLVGAICTFVLLKENLNDAERAFEKSENRWQHASHIYGSARDALLKAEEKDKKYRADAQLAFSKIKEILRNHVPPEVIAKFDEISFTS